MERPTFLSVPLRRGTVVLREWSMQTVDAHLRDILNFSDIVGPLRDDWTDFRPGDLEEDLWESFWRLVRASLVEGSELPVRITWLDRLTLAEAMWALNDLDEAAGKRKALTERRDKALQAAIRRGVLLNP